jgi:hypothetical protein
VLVCTAATVFLAMLSHAEARIQRQRRQGFVAPLQPFSLVHSVVHIVAAQVVDNTLRILEAAAVAPIQVAYYAPRRMRPRPPRAEPIEDLDDESVVRPIRVAYQMPERRLAIAPPSDAGDDYAQEQGDMSLRIETRGDRPTVAGLALLLGLHF